MMDSPTASGQGAARRLNVPWPENDIFRLLQLLGGAHAAPLVACSSALWRRLSGPAKLSQARAGEEALDLSEAMTELQHLLEDVEVAVGAPVPKAAEVCDVLSTLEVDLRTEMRYVHAPDWEMKPGRVISRKGTWLKKSTRFSWDITPEDKLYVPEGVAVPVLQIGRVTDQTELSRHEWADQHLLVWLKPPLLETLEARRNAWFVYWPHWAEDVRPFEGEGLAIAASVDTWLKRSTGMSGELQPFELVYVPKGMTLTLSALPEQITEEWERRRHGHAQNHRKVHLASPPLTMRRDKFDILVGQSNNTFAR